jgi:hypothetical protein
MIALMIILFLFAVYLACLWKWGPQTEPRAKTNYKTVSAGEIDKNYSSNIALYKNIYATGITGPDKKDIDLSDFEIYVVIGNSMQNSGIKDKDFVLVRNLYDEEKYNLKKNNILLIKIDRSRDIPKSNVIDYKLRKFITYVGDGGDIDFDVWFGDTLTENKALTGKKEYLRSKYEKCVEKYRQNNSEQGIFALSSTFNAEIGESDYSFHPVKFLYGIVKYTVKGDKEEC